MLRPRVRVARVSALGFACMLCAWLPLVTLMPAEFRTVVDIAAMQMMGFTGFAHILARVLLATLATRLVAGRGCLSCGYTLGGGAPIASGSAPPPAVCPECGSGENAYPLSPAVRDALPLPRAPIEGVDTPLARAVGVLALLAGLFAFYAMLVSPLLGLPDPAGERGGSSRIAFVLVMFAFNAPAVFRTLCAMRAARKCPRA